MKLLFDESLSPKLALLLRDLFCAAAQGLQLRPGCFAVMRSSLRSYSNRGIS